MLRFAAGLLLSLGLLALPIASDAQDAAPAPPPADVQRLVELLRKPEVQAWLEHGATPVTAVPQPMPPTRKGSVTWRVSFGCGWPASGRTCSRFATAAS